MSEEVKANKKIAPEKDSSTSLKLGSVKRINKKYIMIAILSVTGLVLLGTSLPKEKSHKEDSSAMAMQGYLSIDHAEELKKAKSVSPKSTTLAQQEELKAAPKQAQPLRPPVKVKEVKDAPKETSKVDAPRKYKAVAPAPASPVTEEQARAEYEASKAPLRAVNMLETRELFTASTSVVSPSATESSSDVKKSKAELYKEWNDQTGKKEFQGTAKASAVAVVPPVTEYTVFAGTIIPAVLLTAINTDLPGDILAVVTENVYDTVSGKNILIPQGTKLLAQYNSDVTWGQQRVQVSWRRMIRPDGVNIDIGNMVGVDSKGMSGYQGSVDEHPLQYAKGLGLMMMVSVVTGQLKATAKTINPAGAEILDEASKEIAKVGAEYTNRALDIQPTLRIEHGTRVSVFVNSDLYLPPSSIKAVPRKYTIKE